MKPLLVLMLSPLLFFFGSKVEAAAVPEYVKEYNAGVKAQKDKNYSAAIPYYESAVKQKEDFPDAWNNLGYCYRMVAKSYLVKAGDAYGKAVGYNPKHERALEYQGEYFLMSGEIQNAYSNYKKLKQMGSDQSDKLKERLDEVLKQAQTVLKEYSP